MNKALPCDIDNTILAGLGIASELDLSLSSLSKRGPNAASTAVQRMNREQLLASYGDVEDEEKDELNLVTLLDNYANKDSNPSGMIETREVLKDITQTRDHTTDSNSVRLRKSKSNTPDATPETSYSNLFPSSSFLSRSNIPSFSDENTEAKPRSGTEYGTPLSLPSILISGPGEENMIFPNWGPESTNKNVWDDSETTQDLIAVAQKHEENKSEIPFVRKSNPRNSNRGLDKSTSQLLPFINIQPTPSPPPFDILPPTAPPIQSASSWSLYDAFKEQEEIAAFVEGEEFRAIDVTDLLDAAEAEVLQGQELSIRATLLSGSHDLPVPDLSGYLHSKDVPIRQSFFSGLDSELIDPNKDLCIEDILAAKSCKLGRLEGNCSEMPSFGFAKGETESPPKVVPLESTVDGRHADTTYTASKPNADPTTVFVEDMSLHDTTMTEASSEVCVEDKKKKTSKTGKMSFDKYVQDSSFQKSINEFDGRFEENYNDKLTCNKGLYTNDTKYFSVMGSMCDEETSTDVVKPNQKHLLSLSNAGKESADIDRVKDLNRKGQDETGTSCVDPSEISTWDSLAASGFLNMETSMDVLELRRYREYINDGPTAHNKPPVQDKARKTTGSETKPVDKPSGSLPVSGSTKPEKDHNEAHRLVTFADPGKSALKPVKTLGASNRSEFMAPAKANAGTQEKQASNPRPISGSDHPETTHSNDNQFKCPEAPVSSKSNGRLKMGTGALRGGNYLALPVSKQNAPTMQTMTKPKPVDSYTSLDDIFKLKSDKLICEGGVVGVKTNVELQLRNHTSEMLILSVRKLHDVIHSAATTPASSQPFYTLDFKQSHYFSPKSELNITVGFCSLLPCKYQADIELSLFDLPSLLPQDGAQVGAPLKSKVIRFYTEVTIPKVEVRFYVSGKELDFGLVSESCLVQRNITIINHSPHPVPVLMNLKQIPGFENSFSWSLECTERMELVSPTVLACELCPSSSVVAAVLFRAPRFNSFEGTAKNEYREVVSSIQVTLDTPREECLTLQHVPIKAYVSEVLLKTSRSQLPLRVTKGCVSEFKITNKSLISLPISVKVAGHGALRVQPSSVVMTMKQEATLEIGFQEPVEEGHEIPGSLSIRVEPDGMEFTVPLLLNPKAPSIRVESLLPQHEVQGHNSLPRQNPQQVQHSRPEEKITKSLRLTFTKPNMFFGTVPNGGSMKLRNTMENLWTDTTLNLVITVRGDHSFYFLSENGIKTRLREVEMLPGAIQSFYAVYEPGTCGTISHSGSVVCKPRFFAKPVKITIPLHGYSGSGELSLTEEDKPLNCGDVMNFGDITPGIPLFLRPIVANTGSRFLFIKFIVLPDERSNISMSIADLLVQPDDLVLGPGEFEEIEIVTTGSPDVMRSLPGKIGVLRIIYGDEVLRRRFRALENPSVQYSQLNDILLPKLNLNGYIMREQNAVKELGRSPAPSFPPSQRDAVGFYNSCRSFNLQIHGTCDTSSNAVENEVAVQDTLTSFLDATVMRNENFTKSMKVPRELSSCAK